MPEINESPSTKKIIFSILSIIALADFGLGINTVVLPLYAKSLGASVMTIGLIIASFGVARIITNIPISLISKKLKSHFIHIGILSIFLGALGYLLSYNYYQLFIFRFMEGFGSGIINTSSMIILTKHLYKDKKRAKVLSKYMIARRLSMGSAPFLGAIAAFEFTDKTAFLIYTVIMFAGLLVALYNKSFFNLLELKHADSLKENTDNYPDTGLDKPDKDSFFKEKAKKTGVTGSLPKPLPNIRNMNFILLCLITFSFFFSRIGSRRELVPLVGVGILGLNKADIGLLISVSAIIGVILTYYSDRVINLLGTRNSIIGSFIITIAGISSFIIFNNITAFGASIVLLSAGGGFSGPARNLYLMDSVDKSNYDEAIGIYRTLSDLGFVVGPFAAGAAFYYFNYIYAFALIAGILIFTVSIFAILGKPVKIRQTR